MLWDRTSVACLQPLTALMGECMIAMMTLVVGEDECCVSTTIACISWCVYGRDCGTLLANKSVACPQPLIVLNGHTTIGRRPTDAL